MATVLGSFEARELVCSQELGGSGPYADITTKEVKDLDATVPCPPRVSPIQLLVIFLSLLNLPTTHCFPFAAAATALFYRKHISSRCQSREDNAFLSPKFNTFQPIASRVVSTTTLTFQTSPPRHHLTSSINTSEVFSKRLEYF